VWQYVGDTVRSGSSRLATAAQPSSIGAVVPKRCFAASASQGVYSVPSNLDVPLCRYVVEHKQVVAPDCEALTQCASQPAAAAPPPAGGSSPLRQVSAPARMCGGSSDQAPQRPPRPRQASAPARTEARAFSDAGPDALRSQRCQNLCKSAAPRLMEWRSHEPYHMQPVRPGLAVGRHIRNLSAACRKSAESSTIASAQALCLNKSTGGNTGMTWGAGGVWLEPYDEAKVDATLEALYDNWHRSPWEIERLKAGAAVAPLDDSDDEAGADGVALM